jgi:hypothetical protein
MKVSRRFGRKHRPISGSKIRPNKKTAWSEQQVEIFDPEDGGDTSVVNVG